MPDLVARAAVAVALAAALGALLLALPSGRWSLPRDVALSGYAAVVAVLGVFAVFGAQAASVAAGVVIGVCLLGGMVYAVLALAGRWAER